MAETKTNASQQSDNFAAALKGVQPRMGADVSAIAEKALYGRRGNDTIIVNSNGANASIRLTDNKTNIAASPNTNMKMTDRQNISVSLEEKHTTNRFVLETDEVVVNGHKLNPNLWEYTDYKKFDDMYFGTHSVGNFCVLGTVLIPSWDAQLKKYMLIRRLARMPLFAPKTNVPEILNALNIDDPTKVVNDYQVKQTTVSAEEWYNQVKDQIDKENSQDGDAQEVAPNGRHYFESDIKDKMDQNPGMTREQAIEELSKEDKYTKPWKKDSSDDPDANIKDPSPETAPNGGHYSENDIKNLMNQKKADGSTYSRQEAIDILSKDPKYAKKEDSSSGSSSGSSSSGSGSSNKSEYQQIQNDVLWYFNQAPAKSKNGLDVYMLTSTVMDEYRKNGKDGVVKMIDQTLEQYKDQWTSEQKAPMINIRSYFQNEGWKKSMAAVAKKQEEANKKTKKNSYTPMADKVVLGKKNPGQQYSTECHTIETTIITKITQTRNKGKKKNLTTEHTIRNLDNRKVATLATNAARKYVVDGDKAGAISMVKNYGGSITQAEKDAVIQYLESQP